MPLPPPSPEAIALARRLYAEGAPVKAILAETGLCTGTLYHWLSGGRRGQDGLQLAPLPRRRIVVGRRTPPLKADRNSLVARLWRTAERQARDIEERLARSEQEPGERERDARVLAVLVKTLRELTALDEAQVETNSQPDAAAADDDAVPRDIDELRRDLARRIDRLRQGRAAGRIPGDA